MIVDTFAVVLVTAGFIVLTGNVIVLSRQLKKAELRAVIAEVELKHHKEQAAFEKARDITRQ